MIALAAGMVGGLGLGANSVAALVTRGLAEIVRLAVAEGARVETLMGLAGLGDLVLTCTGELSRNRFVGQELARGRTLDGDPRRGCAKSPRACARRAPSTCWPGVWASRCRSRSRSTRCSTKGGPSRRRPASLMARPLKGEFDGVRC